MSFQTLGLSEPVLRALAAKGYASATPIQAQAIPTVLAGRDLLGIAQTGTGKTAAFMLPSIDRLAASRRGALRPQTCRMLVLAPTRELAGQIADSAIAYGRFAQLRVARIFGGTSIHRNRQDVARGVDMLVATPGRLIDLVEQGALSLREVEILVLDEADQMLDLGFIHALKQIVKLLPDKRQTLFFSATMPKRVAQHVSFVQPREKQALLTMMLRWGFGPRGNMDRVLVFTRTKHGADRVVKLLAGSGIAASAIHGNKSQPQRERALAAFREGTVRILVATDIAARGIDIPGVSHVINFELPNVPEQYVHRIGRTARAGRDGIAIAFCADDEKAYLRDIEKLTRQRLAIEPLPQGFLAEAARIQASRAPVAIEDDAPPARRRPMRGHPQRGRYAHAVQPAARPKRRARG
jgi:ATP-dependent RNA helicase RhlE